MDRGEEQLRHLVRAILREEHIGTAGGVRYYQMGGSLPDDEYNLDDEGEPTTDPGVAALRGKRRRRVHEAKTPTDRAIEDVLEDWVERGIKAPEGPHWFPPRELFRYREYMRRTRPDLQKSMKEKGFDPDRPIWLEFGRNGGVKVGEGNHRLKTAIQLGIEKVPVVFHFENEVVKYPEAKSEWQQGLDRDRLRKQQAELRRAAEMKALGIKKRTPEEVQARLDAMTPEEREAHDRDVDELMGLLGL